MRITEITLRHLRLPSLIGSTPLALRNGCLAASTRSRTV
jgi:hypothetical protein